MIDYEEWRAYQCATLIDQATSGNWIIVDKDAVRSPQTVVDPNTFEPRIANLPTVKMPAESEIYAIMDFIDNRLRLHMKGFMSAPIHQLPDEIMVCAESRTMADLQDIEDEFSSSSVDADFFLYCIVPVSAVLGDDYITKFRLRYARLEK